MKDKEAMKQALQLHLKKLTEEQRLHGARYCVALCHSIVAEGAVGVADSVVDLQSVTKLFTAVAILQLREKRLLSFEDKAARFLHEFAKEPFSEITILQLLTHTSGLAALQDAFPERDLDWEAEVDIENIKESWISAILEKGLFYAPGTKWEYSKAGFCILGEIIHRITGKRAEDYIRDEILLPCGMTKSYWRQDMDVIWSVIPKTTWGLMTPIEELVQFGMMLADGGIYEGKRVFEEASVEALETNWLPHDRKDYCWDHGGRSVAYGAGCPVYVPGYEPWWTVGERTIYHEGSGACMLMVNREKHLAAAWTVPFTDPCGWCEEAVKGTADVVWRNLE